MMAVNQMTFSDFWQEIRRPYLTSCAKFALLWPLTTLTIGYLILLMQCYGWMVAQQGDACLDVSTPLAYLQRWGSLWRLTIVMLIIIFIATLFSEWLNYRNNKPSDFIYGKWSIEGPPGYTRRLREVSGNRFALDTHELQAQVMDEHHRRYVGHFSEEVLLRHIRRKFARSDNKPVLDTPDRMSWKIKQSSGTEVHIDLCRSDKQPDTWTMRTEFYEWAGRKNPPRLAQTHITEFVRTTS